MKRALLGLIEMAASDRERASPDNACLDEAAGVDADHDIAVIETVEIVALALVVYGHGSATRPHDHLAEFEEIDAIPLLPMRRVGTNDDIRVGRASMRGADHAEPVLHEGHLVAADEGRGAKIEDDRLLGIETAGARAELGAVNRWLHLEPMVV